MNTVTRAALILLVAVVVIGLVISFIPNPPALTPGKVQLDGVTLELYPAADLDAKWIFKATQVTFDPETRESIATLDGDGTRLIKGKPNMYLRTPMVTIDGNDNLRTQEAKVFIPKDCYVLKLGQPNAAFVTIDQNVGYTAPYADLNSPSVFQTGPNFSSDFDFKNAAMDIQRSGLRTKDQKLSCEQVKRAMGW
jgi:hypothetical protein